MVNDGIVLGHKVSAAGKEVVRAKIEVMTGLPAPTNVVWVENGYDEVNVQIPKKKTKKISSTNTFSK